MGRVADGVLFAEVAGAVPHVELRMNIFSGKRVHGFARTKSAGK